MAHKVVQDPSSKDVREYRDRMTTNVLTPEEQTVGEIQDGDVTSPLRSVLAEMVELIGVVGRCGPGIERRVEVNRRIRSLRVKVRQLELKDEL